MLETKQKSVHAVIHFVDPNFEFQRAAFADLESIPTHAFDWCTRVLSCIYFSSLPSEQSIIPSLIREG